MPNDQEILSYEDLNKIKPRHKELSRTDDLSVLAPEWKEESYPYLLSAAGNIGIRTMKKAMGIIKKVKATA